MNKEEVDYRVAIARLSEKIIALSDTMDIMKETILGKLEDFRCEMQTMTTAAEYKTLKTNHKNLEKRVDFMQKSMWAFISIVLTAVLMAILRLIMVNT